jgi:hypothetical protein
MKRRDPLAPLVLAVYLAIGVAAAFWSGVFVGRRDGVTLVRSRCAP